MEAATAPLPLTSRLRARAFERECGRLRPLGEAYVARRFSGSLNRADAEDVVSEVLIRLHRKVEEGRGPQNLRAAFFTSVRNASIDVLRARAARPTVALEAAGAAETGEAGPQEWAEGREDAARLQEALGRMRSNYREAILLRFGLGLTVPEMARQLGISLPAAKKLVLRATRQVTKRVEAIEGAEFCPEMRQMARRSLVEKEACGVAEGPESELLHAHFAHCGACKSFLANLHGTLHDLGAAAMLGLAAGDRVGLRFGPLDHLANWVTSVAEGAHSGAGRARDVVYRASGLAPGSDPASAGVLAGAGQKIAAVCTAGAATATCLLTGAVGPGIGATATIHHPVPDRAPQVRALKDRPEVPVSVPEPEEASSAPTTPSEGDSKPGKEAKGESSESPPATPTPSPATPAPSPAPAPEAEPSGEFGLESNAGSNEVSSPAAAPPTATPESPAPSASAGAGDFGGGGSSGSGSSSSSSGSVGFHG